MNSKTFNVIAWILRLVPAIILVQTLFFKFSAAPESVYIFSTLGLEPAGRIVVGILELIAAILLVTPKTTSLGAALGVVLMAGALWGHLTKLGIVVQNDGGELFILALIVLISCLSLLVLLRKQLAGYLRVIAGRGHHKKLLRHE